MVATMAPDAGPEWGGVFWVENLSQAHLTISTPVTRDGRLLAVISSVVSVQALSHFVDDFTLQTGLRHAFVLYGRDRVLAHPALIDNVVGLGPEKQLTGLAAVVDHQLATTGHNDRESQEHR